MENASNALLIAGGVLLAIIIVSIGVMLFNLYFGTSEQFDKQSTVRAIQQINVNYLSFSGRTDITAQEIISCINYTEEFNNNSSQKITINVIEKGNLDNNEFLKTTVENKNLFSCLASSIKYYTDGQVSEISFKKNT